MTFSDSKSRSDATATDAAYDGILDLILSQGLRAGERTSVNLLAARLDMGKTPIKEAIIRLRTEGLLSVSGRSGTTVNEVSGRQAMEMFEARHLIEDFVAGAVVENISPSQLVELNDLLATMKRLSTGKSNRLSAEFVKANKTFHSKIVAASGNVTISRLYDQLQIQSQIINYLLASQPDPVAAARRRQIEHNDIVRAIEKKDSGLLKKLLRAHTADSEKIICEQLGAEEAGAPKRSRGNRSERVLTVSD